MVKQATTSKIDHMSVCGGVLCLDLVNTMSEWLPQQGIEYLVTYEDYIKWTKRLQILSGPDFREFSSTVSVQASLQQKSLGYFRSVRQTLYNTFSTIAGKQKTGNYLAPLIPYFREAHQHLEYQTDRKGKIQLAFDHAQPTLVPIWHALRSAENLLLSHEQWPRIRTCPACGWLFLDTSKGGKRKWCEMQLCGSRDKATRYYYNHKAAG